LAPDIWFSFLNDADPGPLLGICGHNLRDILGLASLFSALARIAREPLEARDRFRCDGEALALYWRLSLLRGGRDFGPAAAGAGRELLAAAAAEGRPRAALVLGLDLLRQGRADEARRQLLAVARGNPGGGADGPVRAAAYRALAVDAEWRRQAFGEALALVEEALLLEDLGEGQRRDLLRRGERLRRRLDRGERTCRE
jgi:hypothetical protein